MKLEHIKDPETLLSAAKLLDAENRRLLKETLALKQKIRELGQGAGAVLWSWPSSSASCKHATRCSLGVRAKRGPKALRPIRSVRRKQDMAQGSKRN